MVWDEVPKGIADTTLTTVAERNEIIGKEEFKSR